MEQSALSPTMIVAARVRELRAARQWSAEHLAAEMNKLGVEWKRGVVTKLETGHREALSVAELFALGLVFEVSPLALLFPSEGNRYEVSPQHVTSMLSVYEWLLGRCPSPDDSCDLDANRDGFPAGLPDGLVAWEHRRKAERDVRERSLRAQNAELQQAVDRLSSPDAPVLATASKLLEDAKQTAQQTGQIVEAAVRQAEQRADQRLAALERSIEQSVLGPLQELAATAPEGTYQHELSSAIIDRWKRHASDLQGDQS